MNRLHWAVKGRLRWLPVALKDAAINRCWHSPGKRFLVVRHAARQPYFYKDFLAWMERDFPRLRGLFELRLLPTRLRHAGEYLLHIPWLQDPLEHWSPRGYRQAMALATDCDRSGIPIVNRVERHRNATKIEGAKRIAQAGFRTPRMQPIVDRDAFLRDLCGWEPPLLVRDANGHGGRIVLVRDRRDAAGIPWQAFRAPAAVEFIDLRDPRDGYYRRYRYIVAGDTGFPQNMHVTTDWESRSRCRVTNEATEREERAHMSESKPWHARFLKAREALQLDFVAFDYSLDAQGQPVVWEANPYPNVLYPADPLRDRNRAAYSERTYAAMLSLYLQRAGLDVPERLRAIAAGGALRACSTP